MKIVQVKFSQLERYVINTSNLGESSIDYMED